MEPTKASILPTQEEVSDVDPKVVQAALDQRKDAGYTKPKAKAKGKAKAKAAAAKPKAKPKAKAKAVAKTKAKASAPVKSTHDPKDPGIGGGTVWWGWRQNTMQPSRTLLDCSLGAQTVVTARFVGAQGHGKGASKPSRMVHESTVSAMISGESMTIVIGEKRGKIL